MSDEISGTGAALDAHIDLDGIPEELDPRAEAEKVLLSAISAVELAREQLAGQEEVLARAQAELDAL